MVNARLANIHKMLEEARQKEAVATKTLNDARAEAKSKLKDAQAAETQAKTQAEEAEKAKKQAEKEVEQAEKEVEQAKQEVEQAEGLGLKLEEAKESLTAVTKPLALVNAKLATVHKMLDEARQKEAAATKKKNDARAAATAAEEELKDAQSAETQAKTKLEEAKSKLEEAEAAETQAKTKLEEAKSKEEKTAKSVLYSLPKMKSWSHMQTDELIEQLIAKKNRKLGLSDGEHIGYHVMMPVDLKIHNEDRQILVGFTVVSINGKYRIFAPLQAYSKKVIEPNANYKVLMPRDPMMNFGKGKFKFTTFGKVERNDISWGLWMTGEKIIKGVVPTYFSLNVDGKVSVKSQSTVDADNDAGTNDAAFGAVVSNYAKDIFSSFFRETPMSMSVDPINIGTLTSTKYKPDIQLNLNFDQPAILANYEKVYGNITLSKCKMWSRLKDNGGLAYTGDDTVDTEWKDQGNVTFKGSGNELIILNAGKVVKSTVEVKTDALGLKLVNVAQVVAGNAVIECKIRGRLTADIQSSRNMLTREQVVDIPVVFRNNLAEAINVGDISNEETDVVAASKVSMNITIKGAAGIAMVLMFLLMVYVIPKVIKMVRSKK